MKLVRWATTFVILITGHYYVLAFSRLVADSLEKPFANRQLIPLLGWAGEQTSVGYDTTVYIVLMSFVFLMAESLRYFYTGFYEYGIYTEIYTIVTSLIVFLLAMLPPHTYDIPTVVLFTLSLAFLQKRKYLAFFLLFPIVCFNRETAILLVLLWIVYTWKQEPIWKGAVLLGIYVLVKTLIHFLVVGVPGQELVVYFWGNLRYYARNPYTVMVIVLFMTSLAALVRARWIYLPRLVKTSIAVFMGVLIPMHAVFGISMEYRVFLEVVPLFTFVGVYPIKDT